MLGIDASRANLKQRTGTEWYSYFLLQRLSAYLPKSLTTTWYTKGPLVDDLLPLPDRVTVRPLHWPPGSLWTQLRLSWEMTLHPPEMLFVPAHTIPLIHPRKTVTTIHDIGFEHQKTLYGNTPIGTSSTLGGTLLSGMIRVMTAGKYGASEMDYHRFSARFALRHAAHIITVSHFSKSEITRTYGADPERITVIHNGYATDVFTPHRDPATEGAMRKRFGLGKRFIISVGRLEHKKNTPGMISAFARFCARHPQDDIQLVLVGNPGFGHDEVLRRIHDHRLQSRVVCTGWLSEHTYVDLLRQSSALFFPSLYEGFGIPVLEAFGCGIPVLTSNSSSLPEVADSAALCVNPYDHDALADGLDRIVYNEQLRRHLREAGLRRAESFSWEITAKNTAELLLHILRSTP